MPAASPRTHDRPPTPLPPVGRAFLAVAFSFLAGALCAVQSVQLVAAQVGLLPALPLGLFTFIVASAVALVLAAHLDVILSRL
jgi:hypothetical protein